MVEASEDDETAFPIKVFIFDKLVHCNSFIAAVFYRGLHRIGNPS
jgi:hypothetical protein